MNPRLPPRRRDPAELAGRVRQLIDLGLEPAEVSPLTTEAFRLDADRYKMSRVCPAMGTLVSVSVLADGRARAEEGLGRAFAGMDRLVELFNRYDPASAVACLNRDGRLADAPPELLEVVGASLDLHRATGGAFDVSVKPLVDLFRDAGTAEPLAGATDREMAEAMERVGAEHIDLSRHGIVFRREGMGVTLDGVAKGHIVDAMAAILEEVGIDAYLINAGGDIRARGTSDGRQPWKVAVREPDPEGARRFRDVVEVSGGAVATSGSYEVYFDRERLSHHIVSARSGASPTASTSVSVVAPTAMEADALATAAFVMGPERALPFIDGLAGRACSIIDAAGRQVDSRGWQAMVRA